MTKDAIEQSARDQGFEIATALVKAGAYLPGKPDLAPDLLVRQLAETQGAALIAYLQKIGAYRTVEKTAPKSAPALDPDATRAATH